MKNDWRDPDDDSDMMIEDLRNDLRDLARAIRHCPQECEQGFHYSVEIRDGRQYFFASPCDCYKRWRAKGRELLKAVKKWERAQGIEYHNLITPEMIFHARPTGDPASAETTERARQTIQGITDFGAECEGLRNQLPRGEDK